MTRSLDVTIARELADRLERLLDELFDECGWEKSLASRVPSLAKLDLRGKQLLHELRSSILRS